MKRQERYCIVSIDRELIDLYAKDIAGKRKFVHGELSAYIEAALPTLRVYGKCDGIDMFIRFVEKGK